MRLLIYFHQLEYAELSDSSTRDSWLIDTRQLSRPLCLKRQPHEGDSLDQRIVTIPCKRVYGAAQARPCETSGCLRLRCTVKVSNKTRLFRSHEDVPLKTVRVAIGRCCRRWRFRWDFPPVANGQENVRCSPRISLICNSSTIQPVNSPSCGWGFILKAAGLQRKKKQHILTQIHIKILIVFIYVWCILLEIFYNI